MGKDVHRFRLYLLQDSEWTFVVRDLQQLAARRYYSAVTVFVHGSSYVRRSEKGMAYALVYVIIQVYYCADQFRMASIMRYLCFDLSPYNFEMLIPEAVDIIALEQLGL